MKSERFHGQALQPLGGVHVIDLWNRTPVSDGQNDPLRTGTEVAVWSAY